MNVNTITILRLVAVSLPLVPVPSARAAILPCAAAPRIGQQSAEKIVERARLEVSRGVKYDAHYRSISFPGGDVPADLGACTDLVVRALRAVGKDLQSLIHADKKRNPARYPKYPGRRSIDTNIDHRRVPNHLAFLRRHGKKLPTSLADLTGWKPGDLVYVKLEGGLDHCGVVSDRNSRDGVPLLIHNLGGAAEEDVLSRWKIVGHIRYP